jgi:acyl carrier protein
MTREIIREFVVREFFAGREPPLLRSDVKLVSSGIVDSVGTMRLVLFLEERFGILIQPEDISTGSLDTLDAMAALVERRQAAVALEPERQDGA